VPGAEEGYEVAGVGGREEEEERRKNKDQRKTEEEKERKDDRENIADVSLPATVTGPEEISNPNALVIPANAGTSPPYHRENPQAQPTTGNRQPVTDILQPATGYRLAQNLHWHISTLAH
jgi:hypothetical protein